MVTGTVQSSAEHQPVPSRARRVDMETLVGDILLGGVLLSMLLTVTGMVWHWATTGHLQVEYSLVAVNLVQFMLADAKGLTSGSIRPQLLISAGIAVLMLTPYVRVLASMAYFALAGRNWKYTLFTGLVLSILTYTLLLR
jgi:uncharacterized membrane protein